MNRYKVTLIVRPASPADDISRMEREVSVSVTADTELEARRVALERAWDQRMLASQVRVVKRRALP